MSKKGVCLEKLLKTETVGKGWVQFYFDFKGSLEAAGKEASKGPDEGGEGRQEDAVDLEGVKVHRFLKWKQRKTSASDLSTLKPKHDLSQGILPKQSTSTLSIKQQQAALMEKV